MRPGHIILIAMICILSFAGCVTISPTYTPPAEAIPAKRSVEVDKPLDSAWTQLIHGLALGSLDILTMDRPTGFVSVSYTGDPEEYVDGGEVTLTASTGLGTGQTVSFPAAKADTTFVITTLGGGTTERHVYLDGKMNIVLQAAGAHRTRITVNARYMVTVSTVHRVAGEQDRSTQEVITFTTGQPGRSQDGCVFQATGRLEEQIAALVR